MTELERFEALFMPEPNSGCWLWLGSINNGGYARFNVMLESNDWVVEYGHRVSWRLYRGEIPDGLVIDHLCRIRICVNPDHLEPVQFIENVRRGSAYNGETCRRGHPYSEDNLHINVRGQRVCMECQRMRLRSSRRRRRDLGLL